MAHFEIDLPPEELTEIPLIPNGTQVTVQIAGDPEIKTSEKNTAYSYLAIQYAVVKAEKPEYVGLSIFENQTLPTKAMKAKLATEGKDKGWRLMVDGYTKFCKLFGVDKQSVDTRRLAGKKVVVSLTVDEYNGKKSNKIGSYLSAA